MRTVNWAALTAALVLVSGCSTATHILFPKPAPPVGGPVEPGPGATAASTGPLPPLVMPSLQETGTFVGQKVKELADELAKLQSSLASHGAELDAAEAQANAHAQSYHALTGEIEAKLQAGTTIGNPILVEKWNAAQGQLGAMEADVNAMGTAASHIAADAGMSTYLLNAIRGAYTIAGAVDEDHANLAKLEEAANAAAVRVDRLQNRVSGDVQRQNSFVTAERANLTNLALAINTGHYFGESLAPKVAALTPATPNAPSPAPVPAVSTQQSVASGRKPLVVIRFDRPDVPYQQPLYDAISKALERKPSVVVDLVAVAVEGKDPGEGALKASDAAREADAVVRSLVAMGLPRDRITVTPATSAALKANQIELYVR